MRHKNEGPGGCVPWEKYMILATGLKAVSRAEDVYEARGLARDALVAVKEKDE